MRRSINATPTEQMTNVYAAFEETEEYYELAGEVVRLAREFLISKKSLSAAYRDGHKVLSEVATQRRKNMHKMEDEFDKAVEELEVWLKSKAYDLAEPPAPVLPTQELKKGDYVLATKWSDGHPQDAWCVGFFEEMMGDRFIVIDGEGKRFRHSGFRRAEAISKEQGEWLLKNARLIETTDNGLWDYWIKEAAPVLPSPAMLDALDACREAEGEDK